MTDYQAALTLIENTALRDCPSCGTPGRWTQPMLVGLPDVGGGVLKDEGIEAFAYTCLTCSFVRLFNASAAVHAAEHLH